MPGGNTYQFLQGTSMASPVVAGLAALILEYYPTLSAVQIKEIIERSAVPVAEPVNTPGNGQLTTFSTLSKSGGIINAYEAVRLAATYKGERKMEIGKNEAKTIQSSGTQPKKTKGF